MVPRRSALRSCRLLCAGVLALALAAPAGAGLRPGGGRLWTYCVGFPGPVQLYDVGLNVLTDSFFPPPPGTGNGRGIAYDPCDGNIWISSVNGNFDGDGWLYKYPPTGGPEILQIPEPGGARGPGIGALDFDPEENVLWAAGYQPIGGRALFYKLDPADGTVLATCAVPLPSGAPGGVGNDSLAIARPADLIGMKVLLSDMGETLQNLLAVDLTTCAVVRTYPLPLRITGIDVDEPTGDLIVSDAGGDLFNLGPAPYTTIIASFVVHPTPFIEDIALDGSPGAGNVICDPGGPYLSACAASPTCLVVDGSGSSGTGALTYLWTSDCPGADFGGTEMQAVATLCLLPTGCSTSCSATLDVRNSCFLATASAQVTVADITPPVLAGVPADATVACDAIPPPAPVTATDVCDPAPSVTLVESQTPGSCPQSYLLTRTWTATDACMNIATASQILTVRDIAPPVLSGVPADATVACDAVPPPAPVTASDACDPAPAVVLVQTVTPGSCPQSYLLTRTWTATDACGNAASAVQHITVRDTTPPVLLGVPPDATVECDAVPPPPAVTAADSCDPGPLQPLLTESRIDGSCPGNYVLVRTWTVADHCGNTASASQTLTVRDTKPPEIDPGSADLACLWPPNHWYVCFTGGDFVPSITDRCSGPVTWRFAGCASDQPDDAPDPSWPGWNGDGDTHDDCVVLPGGEDVCARAERCGTGPTAQDGRHYALSIVATDACGNSSAPVPIGAVHVPHDQSPHPPDCIKTTERGCRPNEPIPCR